jgi:hypothetical protein
MAIHPMGDLKVCKPRWFTPLAPTVILNRDDTQGPRQDTTGENGPDWKSTTLAGLKLLLRTAKESADVFPPLKAVLGGLCSILENYDVWFISYITRTAMLTVILASTSKQASDRIVGTPDKIPG